MAQVYGMSLVLPVLIALRCNATGDLWRQDVWERFLAGDISHR